MPESMWNVPVELAREYSRQAEHVEPGEAWTPQEWRRAADALLMLVQAEASASRVGEVLRYDDGLSLPVAVVKATYERLFAIEINDVRSRLCYARYLLVHGLDWDQEAGEILRQVEEPARQADVWMPTWPSSGLLHKPAPVRVALESYRAERWPSW
ncbi:hypothetical protein [Amycolatopsis sp. FDAARGOS 1241]|uniref:hypothetical protein n=1 Tax=Amycolatopsis sp. FDAARGOS 1241 TaxID=2778070 RepID=UPI0019514B77|nr:hypothetical protein [Amycolatopsis sp. FDAARGOS 1241]QRP42710.1 hypothetical protein I6J71_24800 [Amycolatopsis sp. FDAARGOS 1241]